MHQPFLLPTNGWAILCWDPHHKPLYAPIRPGDPTAGGDIALWHMQACNPLRLLPERTHTHAHTLQEQHQLAYSMHSMNRTWYQDCNKWKRKLQPHRHPCTPHTLKRTKVRYAIFVQLFKILLSVSGRSSGSSSVHINTHLYYIFKHSSAKHTLHRI